MIAVQGLNVGQYGAHDFNMGFLKRYTEDYYKVSAVKVVRKQGFEEIDPSDFGKKNSVMYEEKLPESIARARTRCHELALCNDWEYFITLTVDSKKCNRKHLNVYNKTFSIWRRNYNTKYGIKIEFLFIPEQHKNGAWHMHGLIMGLPEEHLTPFSLKQRLPHKMKKMIRDGRELYNWQAYADKFGFVSIERVRSKEKIAAYITKYMEKQLETTKIKPNDHLYYCSKGLKRAELVYKSQIVKPFVTDYTPNNNFVKVKVYKTIEEAIEVFADDNDGTIYPSIWETNEDWHEEATKRPPVKCKYPKALYPNENGFIDIPDWWENEIDVIFGIDRDEEKPYNDGVQASFFE